MKQPVEIKGAQVFVDSASGAERRTTLVLRFPTGDVHVDISLGAAGRIRKLDRVAAALPIDVDQESVNEAKNPAVPSYESKAIGEVSAAETLDALGFNQDVAHSVQQAIGLAGNPFCDASTRAVGSQELRVLGRLHRGDDLWIGRDVHDVKSDRPLYCYHFWWDYKDTEEWDAAVLMLLRRGLVYITGVGGGAQWVRPILPTTQPASGLPSTTPPEQGSTQPSPKRRFVGGETYTRPVFSISDESPTLEREAALLTEVARLEGEVEHLTKIAGHDAKNFVAEIINQRDSLRAQLTEAKREVEAVLDAMPNTVRVAESRALVLYAEAADFPLKGAFIEAGIALGMGKPVIVCLPDIGLLNRTYRPIGSWIAHSLVTRCDDIKAAVALASAQVTSDRGTTTEPKNCPASQPESESFLAGERQGLERAAGACQKRRLEIAVKVQSALEKNAPNLTYFDGKECGIAECAGIIESLLPTGYQPPLEIDCPGCGLYCRNELQSMITEANKRGRYDIAAHYENVLRRFSEQIPHFAVVERKSSKAGPETT